MWGLLLALAGFQGAFATPAPTAQAPQHTYDAAQNAYDKGDWATAAAGFSTLLPPAPAGSLNRSQAVIASRYADSLFHLDRLQDASAWIEPATTALSHDPDPAFLAEALLVEGEVERAEYDFPAALDAYGRAIAAFGPGVLNQDTLSARIAFAQIGATLEPAKVSDVLTPLLQAPDFAKRVDRPTRAQVEDLAARAALNLGDKVAASRWVKQAVLDSGALGFNINVLQSYVRNDAGMIARLNNDNDVAREYFTYSGAGHMDGGNWIGGHTGDLPVCEGETGDIRPDDSVVIRFEIGDDGRVTRATPVYASRTGLLGERVARTVAEWRWPPDALRKVEPFWRSTLELELRCVSRPRPTEFDAQSWRAASAWLSQKGLLHEGDEKVDHVRDGFVVASDDPRLGTADGPVLEALARPVGPDKVQGLWGRLDAIHAPAFVYALMIERAAGRRERGLNTVRDAQRARAEDFAAWTPEFERRFPDDAALAWLLLDQAIAWEGAQKFVSATPLVERVLAMPPSRLTENDPVRKVALLHRAIDLQHAGQEQAAAESLEKSGLTANQCALFDTHPIPKTVSIANSAFPQEALRWGFEGYVLEAFDIDDDGSVSDVRTVVAYPPYIFEAGTEAAVAKFRYFPPRLGGHAVGCEDQRVPVVYHIGH